MKPTKFNNLNSLLEDFTAGHKRILGDNLIGLYLQGSAAVGDMDEHSDVDFIAVLKQDLDGPVLEDLREFNREIFDRRSDIYWAEHLEGSYFPIDVLQDVSAVETELLYLDNGAREMTRDTHCNTLVVRWCLYEYAIPLFGPDFKTLMDPVPIDQMKADVHEIMTSWGSDILEHGVDSSCFYQQFITGLYCRTLHTLASGRVHSKRASLEWAKADLDPEWHPLFDQVIAERASSAALAVKSADPADMQRTLEFVAYANSISERYISQEQTNV